MRSNKVQVSCGNPLSIHPVGLYFGAGRFIGVPAQSGKMGSEISQPNAPLVSPKALAVCFFFSYPVKGVARAFNLIYKLRLVTCMRSGYETEMEA